MARKDDIHEDLASWIPGRRREPAKPYLRGTAAQMALVRDFIDAGDLELEPGTATGMWLDLLADGYGLTRGTGERDGHLQRRAVRPGVAVTAAHILSLINEVMYDEGLAEATIEEWYEGNHFADDPAQPNGLFLNFDSLVLPNGFTVFLDVNTPVEICAEVGTIVQYTKAAGVRFKINLEIVGPPLAAITNDGLGILTDDDLETIVAG